jgi:ankyrin repeat protein
MSLECADANGERPLLEAAGGGHPDVCRLLVDRSADVNCRGKFNRTPLFRAAFGGHEGAVRCLLLLGADPRLYDHEGAVPLQVRIPTENDRHFCIWSHC